MRPYLKDKSMMREIISALLLAIALLARDLKAEEAFVKTKAETRLDPFHLSWTTKHDTRYDLVFATNGTIKNLIKLQSDSNNYLTKSLDHCVNYSACLFKNGTHLESFRVEDEHGHPHETLLNSVTTNSTASSPRAYPLDECDIGNKIKIIHYCSTHWNPPIVLYRFNCSSAIEWHSPITCHENTTNHEKPCYIYESTGKLIDLTPWVLSNGSSYKIDTSNTTIKQFNLNVCNEAHEPCGPNVAACFVDEHSNIVESGYSNLTSLKYDAKERTVLLTALGHYKQQCGDSRVRTVVRFRCKDKIGADSKPKLVRSTACENIIEWPSVRACPVVDINIPEKQCKLKYAGVEIDIKKLTGNKTLVEVPGIKLDGRDKKMMIGICQPVPKTLTCGGKLNSNTKACLMDANDNSTVRSANNSLIVGVATKSFIKLSDEKLYLESRALNHSCSEVVRDGFNVTQQVGTKIEFFCSQHIQDKPNFLGYDDCTYVFEWGSPLLCFENSTSFTVLPKTNQTKPLEAIAKQPAHINLKKVLSEDHKVQIGLDQLKKEDSKPTTEPSKPLATNNFEKPKKTTNGVHAFFMISGIVMFFTAFIVVIFVLDKKTRLRITLRQARQAFQTNNQPYSRVIDDLDL